ncbi:hypothetical protein [Mesorhizobium sp. LjNodule214]|uniref:hypothetical protein n=1 Tax=Mesorhizobium sp. LjNodule214 TaxID=3342252 RepID=UPI003ECE30F3
MHHNNLKALLWGRGVPALVGEFVPSTFLGEPSEKFEGKAVTSGTATTLDGFECPLSFLLSNISIAQTVRQDGKPSWRIESVGIPIEKPIGVIFSGGNESFETEINYAFVNIFEPEKSDSEKSAHLVVPKDSAYCLLGIYKSRDEIAELVKVISTKCRVAVTIHVKAWSTGYQKYLPRDYRCDAHEPAQISCYPGVASLQFSQEDLDLFLSNVGTDTEGDLGEPSGEIYGELKSINRQLASFQKQISWFAIILFILFVASGALSRWHG